MKSIRLLLVIFLPVIALAGASCGPVPEWGNREGGGKVTGAPAISSSSEVEEAVVRIEGPSTSDAYRDPQTGEQMPISGSGFVIDPSGIAVTNNHVVAGTGYLDVYVEGEQEPRGAEVLGVSECSDLAVIDIEGDGFPYLAFHEGEVEAGLSVDAAGFPMVEEDEEPAYSQTGGQVTRAEADGETQYSSLDVVVEHDASIVGGNSGGPLVDEKGRVVGINFGGSLDEEGNPTEEGWAISAEEALQIIPTLREDEDVDSIGINGEAYVDEPTGGVGVYVWSVEDGSPAEEVGVREGDYVQQLGGADVAVDGTMAEYCNVLRGRDGSEEPLSITVAREETGEYLEGDIGEIGGEPLKPVGKMDYRLVGDDSGALVASVPTGWSDVDGRPVEFENITVDATVAASADLRRYKETYEEPGVTFSASQELADYTAEEYLDANDISGDCQDASRESFDDGYVVGSADYYTGCGPSGNDVTVVAAIPESQEYIVVVEIITTPDEAGVEARDLILDTFFVAYEEVLLG